MQALSDVVRQGKVRYLGFREWSPDQIRAAQAMVGTERFVSSQPQYSLLWLRQPEAEIFLLCRAEGDGPSWSGRPWPRARADRRKYPPVRGPAGRAARAPASR